MNLILYISKITFNMLSTILSIGWKLNKYKLKYYLSIKNIKRT